MATRTRTSSTPVRYEDFQPEYEWKDELTANVLLVHLPTEFSKEHIRITYVQSSRTIRINGEKPLFNNKWRRFNLPFTVPENCDVSRIDGRFQDGVLTITMPKLIIKQLPPSMKPEPKPTEEEPLSTPPRRASTTSAGKSQDNNQTTTTANSQTPQERTFRQTVDIAEQAPSPDRLKRKYDEKTSPPVAAGKQEKPEVKPPAIPEGAKTSLIAAAGGDDQDSSKKRKEKTEKDETDALKALLKQNLDKFSGSDIAEKPNKEMIFQKVKNAAATAKGIAMELSEDRQAMVNIGVAVLVIVAIGAYMTYSYGSSRSAKD